MNPSVKAFLLTLVVSAAFAPVAGSAAVITQVIDSTAIAHCQSFTPGVTNTIRNRVIGSENIGNPLAIACAFEVDSGAITQDGVQSVTLFLNNHGTASFDVPCTLAVGPEGEFSYYISKTTTVAPGVPNYVQFTPEDAGSTDPGFMDWLVGLTCTLPKNAIITETLVSYSVDNGA